jgi:hypothetical protein
VSRLFGELFSLLEDRDETIDLPALDEGQKTRSVTLPPDLFFIGTMNLIDQSVEQLDFALRRRFLWLPTGFQRDLIAPVVEQKWKARSERRTTRRRASATIRGSASATRSTFSLTVPPTSTARSPTPSSSASSTRSVTRTSSTYPAAGLWRRFGRLPTAIWRFNHPIVAVPITVGMIHGSGELPPALTTSSAVTIAM